MDEAFYWYKNETYQPDEIAVRFKLRIVCIHCFANGNGRNSRLMADIIIEKLIKQSAFSWGASNINNQNDIRANYLKAVKLADHGDYSLLLSFTWS